MTEGPVSIEHRGPVAVVWVDNPPVNAVSEAVRRGLMDAVRTIDADAGVRAAVLACRGRTFVAGADVREFDKPPQPPHLPEVIAAIEAAAKPWVAAIHGTALGGGFELALGCRYRVAEASARVGLPEVTLGVIPGAGGTVRLPRLVGVEAAIAWVTGGRPVSAGKAQANGAVDEVVDADVVEAAIARAAEPDTAWPPALCEREIVEPLDAGFWAAQESAVERQAKGSVAPLEALAQLRIAVESPFDAAMARERETFLRLRTSPQAAALRHVFFAERAATKPPEVDGVEPVALSRIGVVGGGTMGAGIAVALLDAGLSVCLVERDEAAVARARENVLGLYQGSVDRGRLTVALRDARLARLELAADYAVLADADLVIEAVFEDLAVKQAVFASLDAVCPVHTILATNTSYLDPNAIAQGLSVPERFLGLHFFSPAHIMKLLEIVAATATSTQTLATGFALARRLGKVPVLAGVCDGFIGNRILKVYRAQAERLLLAGCTPADVDAAMRGFGMPMGPFEAQDMGGLDIAAFQRAAARERGEAVFAPVADRLVAIGRLGRKTGGGWYDYPDAARKPVPSTSVFEQIQQARVERGATERSWMPEAVVECMLYPMIDEGFRILDEGIARRAADIDLVEIHGYGFPRWRGGLMFYGESLGGATVLEGLRRLAADGLAGEPSAGLEAAATAAAR